MLFHPYCWDKASQRKQYLNSPLKDEYRPTKESSNTGVVPLMSNSTQICSKPCVSNTASPPQENSFYAMLNNWLVIWLYTLQLVYSLPRVVWVFMYSEEILCHPQGIIIIIIHKPIIQCPPSCFFLHSSFLFCSITSVWGAIYTPQLDIHLVSFFWGEISFSAIVSTLLEMCHCCSALTSKHFLFFIVR